MLDELSGIEDAVASLLSALKVENMDRSIIENKVREIARIQDVSSESSIQQIVKKLEERFNTTMSLGVLFAKEDHKPWLDNERGNIEWYFSKRYNRFLTSNKYSEKVINSMDMITDKILDHIENPVREGSWAGKGLVVGHVQSGKTANYIGVICKAADAGYKVIIVLAGVLNTLRNQTQVRIEKGFTGVDSTRKFNGGSFLEALIGVGLYSKEHIPVTFTTGVADFNRRVALQIGAKLASFNEPVVLVIKKNSSVLGNLVSWVKSNNMNLESLPLLLIDDEADQASINTKKMENDTTAINKKIRELLSLFSKNSYIGYTATPFANIFINPDNRDDMLGDELFPRDFIISLDPPSNYVGTNRIFCENGDLDIVREISDFGDLLPLKHKITNNPPELPGSLYEAIRVFVLAKAARLLRGQVTHNSMLVNISRFTAVQSRISLLIHEYLDEVRNAIWCNYKLSFDRAIQNTQMHSLYKTWENEFSGTEYNWREFQSMLKESVSSISVIEVNSSRNSEPLDYNIKNYPNGRSLIAVGGFSLSRGLTLEGLTVSYFLRNTKMYDTLLQMGRWFGYRNNYEDLCRIYMPAESIAWYRYISGVTEELRDEFKRMRDMQMTPADFGLAVRTHPDSLIITARNKMRTGRTIPRKIALAGRLVETYVLSSKEFFQNNNKNVYNKLLLALEEEYTHRESFGGYFYKKVSSDLILTFIDGFYNHPAAQLTDSKPLIDHIKLMSPENDELLWDVLVVSPKSKYRKISPIEHIIGDLRIRAQRRKIAEDKGDSIVFNKGRVGSKSHEHAGLSDEILQSLKKDYNTLSKVPPNTIRLKRKRPLLILHLIDCRKHDFDEESLFPEGLVAYGISFPGESIRGKAKTLVEYMVNTVYWENIYTNTLDVEEEIDE